MLCCDEKVNNYLVQSKRRILLVSNLKKVFILGFLSIPEYSNNDNNIGQDTLFASIHM